MNNLILIRHGMSFWNKDKRFTGWADIDLHENGKLEAERAGQLVKDLKIEFNGYFSSKLKRSINTLNIILKILGTPNAKVNKAWELNERHYGNLTSLNKEDIKKKFGDKQVQIWRRSFGVRPPPMEKGHPYKDKISTKIRSESLKDTVERVIPYYEKKISPLLSSKKNVLVVFHGNSCRALLMKIFKISKKKIVNLEIPTGNPLLIKFDESLKIKDFKYLDSSRAKKILTNI
jgi:2,3-bisphosphoglycerate-dependent phosphoglycerate mutase